jgi:hypothetical protein
MSGDLHPKATAADHQASRGAPRGSAGGAEVDRGHEPARKSALENHTNPRPPFLPYGLCFAGTGPSPGNAIL